MDNGANAWDDTIRIFLNKCHITFEHYDQLNKMLVPRDVLLSKNLYDRNTILVFFIVFFMHITL